MSQTPFYQVRVCGNCDGFIDCCIHANVKTTTVSIHGAVTCASCNENHFCCDYPAPINVTAFDDDEAEAIGWVKNIQGFYINPDDGIGYKSNDDNQSFSTLEL